MTRMGTESPKAWATPPNAFSVPGPCCMTKTPIRSAEVTRLTASAMCKPVRSCLTMIVRMSACADASMMVLTGYPMRNSTPSRFRISAMAAAAFMWAPLARNFPRAYSSPARLSQADDDGRNDAFSRYDRGRLTGPNAGDWQRSSYENEGLSTGSARRGWAGALHLADSLGYGRVAS